MDALSKLRSIDPYMHTEKSAVTLQTSGSGSGTTNAPPLREASAFCEREESFRRLVSLPVHYAVLPNGGHIPLLKTALTTACERNCTYCAFRVGRDFRRQTFSPAELAKVFIQLYQSGVVKGLFLSSGVAGGGCQTQDRLLASAEILRRRYKFQGYIHLKIMPGAERAQVEQGMRLADRVSVNLEAPTDARLSKLAPQKQFLTELLEPLKWVEQIRQEQPPHLGWNGRWPSSTTQFVVGAIDETDTELLQATQNLHRSLGLTRVYFSGFEPVSGTPLEGQPAVDPLRSVRLYQASFLLRDYGFDFEDLSFSGDGNLPLSMDPKMAWAQIHLRENPLEINRATYEELLRVPGIGPVNAKRIISQRKEGGIRSMGSLRKMGVVLERAAPYLLVHGHHPPVQIPLPL